MDVIGSQKTLKAKNIGTLSKKFKLPEIGDKERAEAAVQVEMQKIRVDTTEYWKRLRVSVTLLHHVIIM